MTSDCGIGGVLPDPPPISAEDLAKCRESGDYSPVLFEWYKFTGALCNVIACFRRDSPALNPPPPRDYAVLAGLLNRCARLMLANVALSHKGLFGETTAIIDRCIFESAIKVIWLCRTKEVERFERAVADGLKTELEFKERIEANIQMRHGITLTIEARMLKSIENYIRSSGMAATAITSSAKLPDLASMITAIKGNTLLYLVGQKFGSHHVHGTWPSLRMHYLEETDGELHPRDHNCRHACEPICIHTPDSLGCPKVIRCLCVCVKRRSANIPRFARFR